MCMYIHKPKFKFMGLCETCVAKCRRHLAQHLWPLETSVFGKFGSWRSWKNDLELDYRNALLRVGITETGGDSSITGIACLFTPSKFITF